MAFANGFEQHVTQYSTAVLSLVKYPTLILSRRFFPALKINNHSGW